jgi:hypothetical protein
MREKQSATLFPAFVSVVIVISNPSLYFVFLVYAFKTTIVPLRMLLTTNLDFSILGYASLK